MDHRCHECQANLRWHRLIKIKEGINGVALHPPTTLCPFCKADLVWNTSRYERGVRYWFLPYLVSLTVIRAVHSAPIRDRLFALTIIAVAALALLGLWLDRGWPRFVLRNPGQKALEPGISGDARG